MVQTAEQMKALANLPPELALMRMENDNIQALAAARPRDHQKIREDLVAQIDAYPSFVRTAIYCKPVGEDKNGNTKYARGLSIRAAEAIAEAYGFCRIRADVTPIDEDSVKIEATFSDYQKGRIWQDGGVLTKFYKDRFGKMQRIPDDRFYSVNVKGEVSKRVREVILRSVPPGLRSELYEMVEARIDDLLDDKTVEKIIANFANKDVTQEVLEAHIGRTRRAGWTKEDRRTLIELWNALEQDETTVAEIVGHDSGRSKDAGGKSKKTAPVKGTVSVGDLTSKQLSTTAGAGEESLDQTTPDESPAPSAEPEDAQAEPVLPGMQMQSAPPKPAQSKNGNDKTQYRCTDADCDSGGLPFDDPQIVRRGRDKGTLLCPFCAGMNIESVV